MAEDKKEEENKGNTDFKNLVDTVNKHINKCRKYLPEENVSEYNEVIAELFGVISIYDNWLKGLVEENKVLESSLAKKDSGKSKIITLN